MVVFGVAVLLSRLLSAIPFINILRKIFTPEDQLSELIDTGYIFRQRKNFLFTSMFCLFEPYLCRFLPWYTIETTIDGFPTLFLMKYGLKFSIISSTVISLIQIFGSLFVPASKHDELFTLISALFSVINIFIKIAEYVVVVRAMNVYGNNRNTDDIELRPSVGNPMKDFDNTVDIKEGSVI